MNETGKLLDDSVSRMLQRILPDMASGRRAAGLRETLLAEWSEAGLGSALVSEARGGLALSLADASVIAWRWGFFAAPLPVVEMLLSGWLCDQAGLDAPEDGASVASAPGVSAPALGASGRALSVDVNGAGETLVTAVSKDVFSSLAGEPWLRLASAAPDGPRASLPDGTASRLAAMGALLTAAQMTGAMARILEIVIEHANTRQQFGRPLGKFQAVQNLIAEAASEQMVCQAAVAAAIASFDRAGPQAFSINSAKHQAGRAATIVAANTHQAMGAIGFTEEHMLGQYTRRLWDWRDHWGRQDAAAEALGLAAASDQRGLWRFIVEP